MEKRIIAIGGGEIRNKTTLKIDEYVANLAKIHAGDKRANALFIGTASHDSMPYFNSFRKTYTSVFDIKAEVALIVYGEMDTHRIKNKIDMADCIYIGGGDTLYMLDKWRETGLDKLVLDAYEQGKIICGLSAGAICWFKDMYTDYEIMRGVSADYVLEKGLGILDGTMCPHFNERESDFTLSMQKNDIKSAYCVENDCAIEFVDGVYTKTISAGGKAYMLKNQNGEIVREELL
jgi:dipeptidase E